MKNEKNIKFILEQVKLGKVDVEDALDLLKELISGNEDSITINPSPIGIPYVPPLPSMPGIGIPSYPTYPTYPTITYGYETNPTNTKQTPK